MRGSAKVLTIGALVAALVTGVLVVTEPWETPLAFCPDSVDSDEPEAESELDARPAEYVEYFDVDESGEMTDQREKLDGLLPNNYTKQALICQYRQESDEELGTCGYSATLLATRYAYKIYEIPSKRLLDKFELMGDGRCPGGITVLEGGSRNITARPWYHGLADRLDPLLS